MKKFVILALVFALIAAAMLAACTNKDREGAASDEAADSKTADAESWDSIAEVIPGVAWSDLVEQTEEPTEDAANGEGSGAESGDESALSEMESLRRLLETAVELPIIPVP